jgi:molybdopterin/thiamine biosynthesis adenylyltransferase
VAVVGLGSGGSAIAVALAAAGVGTLHLFDHDHLSVDNLHRHVCDLRHIGRAKVRALRDIIADYNLPTKVIGHEVDVVQDAKQLWVAASEVDLLVGATDNTASRRFVNYVAIHTGTLLVMGCAFDNARIGEIIQVVPEVSACYECTRKYLIGSGALVAGNHIGESDRISYGGDEPLAEGESNTGTRVEVSLIANLQAKICIHILMYPMTASDAGSVGDAKQNGLARNATQLPANYLTWGVSADTENNSRGEPFAFDLPFCVNWLPIPRHEECPVCGLIGRDNEDDLGQRYADIMASVQPSEA